MLVFKLIYLSKRGNVYPAITPSSCSKISPLRPLLLGVLPQLPYTWPARTTRYDRCIYAAPCAQSVPPLTWHWACLVCWPERRAAYPSCCRFAIQSPVPQSFPQACHDHCCPPRTINLKICAYVHDDIIKWKYFPLYWPCVRRIHRSAENSPHKGQWRGAFMFSLICTGINGWVNNPEAGDLRRHRDHNDITLMGLCVSHQLLSKHFQRFCIISYSSSSSPSQSPLFACRMPFKLP